jgi:uncharacterized protein (TIGR02453 family)
MGYFGPELFAFLRQLKRNNNRDWFNKNKERYVEDVQQPALDFVASMAPGLHKISKNIVADPRPVGGSMFRIYRDVRFAKDKSPYKTAVGISFPLRSSKDVHSPGFYLHLEPGDVFVGAGIWRPDTQTAHTIRSSIVKRPDAWKKAAHTAPFSKRFRMSEESLVRAPRGFDPDHPFVDDLRRKSFIGILALDEKSASSPRFGDTFLGACKDASPLMRFLCEALGATF